MSSTTKPTQKTKTATRARSISQLYRQQRRVVFRVALRYGAGDREWAEDVTQEVFVQAVRHQARVLAMENPAGWLYRTATNLCLKRLRRARFLTLPAVRWLFAQRGHVPASPEELGIHRDELRCVFAIVGRMPAKMQACFFMHHVDGMGYAEIGSILGCSKSYVCKLLKRADARIELRMPGTEPR